MPSDSVRVEEAVLRYTFKNTRPIELLDKDAFDREEPAA